MRKSVKLKSHEKIELLKKRTKIMKINKKKKKKKRKKKKQKRFYK